MYRFAFVTLFPETIDPWLTTSMMNRGAERGLFTYTVHNLREFAVDARGTVDSRAYGGGRGMVLRVEPLAKAVAAIVEGKREEWQVLVPSAAGRPASRELVAGVEAGPKNLIFACGHYEGIDQRFLDHFCDWEYQWGGLVLTGGELPALAMADALVRRIGLLEREGAVENESFELKDPISQEALLEYPHYTRPRVFQEWEVPEVLLSGDHKKIEQWRLQESRKRSVKRCPSFFKLER